MKTAFVFGVALIGSIMITSCSKESESFQPNSANRAAEEGNASFQAATDSKGEPYTSPISVTCTGGGDDEDPLIIGSIRDATQDPIQGATVTLIDASSSTAYASTSSDLNGDYCFNVLSDGYLIEVVATGYSMEETSTFGLGRDTTISFILQ